MLYEGLMYETTETCSSPITVEMILIVMVMMTVMMLSLMTGVEAGIPHISDSVELTKFRLGLSGLHIFAFSSGDICWASLEL